MFNVFQEKKSTAYLSVFYHGLPKTRNVYVLFVLKYVTRLGTTSDYSAQ